MTSPYSFSIPYLFSMYFEVWRVFKPLFHKISSSWAQPGSLEIFSAISFWIYTCFFWKSALLSAYASPTFAFKASRSSPISSLLFSFEMKRTCAIWLFKFSALSWRCFIWLQRILLAILEKWHIQNEQSAYLQFRQRWLKTRLHSLDKIRLLDVSKHQWLMIFIRIAAKSETFIIFIMQCSFLKHFFCWRELIQSFLFVAMYNILSV